MQMDRMLGGDTVNAVMHCCKSLRLAIAPILTIGVPLLERMEEEKTGMRMLLQIQNELSKDSL
jgi:hypothetical protein